MSRGASPRLSTKDEPANAPAPTAGSSQADSLPELSETETRGLGRLHVSSKDIHTRATVNDDGRLDVHINHCSNRLENQVLPTLHTHVRPQEEGPKAPVESLPGYMVKDFAGLPPPRMNIVIHVVGSRGDVQPFVSLGQVLREQYGHRVRLATHPVFQGFVEENGLEFFSIGGDPAELMAFMVKNPGLMPTLDTIRRGEVGRRRRGMYEILKGCWRSCIEMGNGLDKFDSSQILSNPSRNLHRPFIADAIIANPPSFAHVHCAERLGVPLHMMFTMPWSPTQSFPHPLTTIHHSSAEPSMTNLISYALVDMMTWQGLGDIVNRFRTKILDLEPVSLMWAPGMISRLRIPFTYCWSPALIPKPRDWGDNIFLSGFYFLSLASAYTPDPELEAFLNKGPPPVYIGFGSIVVDDPDTMTKLIFEAVKKAGVRAIVSKGWGGLGADELEIPENIFLIGNIPHDWLFKRVSAVVHHGGAGTTAAGILAGKPTVVIPFFGDQPFWGAMTARAGAGPDPIPYKRLTSDNLADAILKALSPETKEKAKKLSEGISKDEGAVAGAQSFHRMLDVDRMRCMVCPNRVAVARIRRTNIRLSALAVIVLGDEGLLKCSDIKLYRSREYCTGEQPWDPITGGASAILGTVSSMMIGIADVPVEIISQLRSIVEKGPSKGTTKPASTTSTRSKSDSISSRRRPDSVASGSTNITDPTSIDATNSDRSEGGRQSEERHAEPSPRTSETSRHNIGVHPAPNPEHDHLIDPVDRVPNSALERAEEGISRIAITALRPPMDFSMALARGFHNAPKIYGDDTVRPSTKVDDFKSGLSAAGKEFGFGWYDGLSGLVTQPIHGAKKHGAKGFLAGVGKGVSGLVLKPGAAIFGLGGYTFKGVYREIQQHMGSTTHSYIISSRITQGHEDFEASTEEERRQIIENYHKIKADPQLMKEKVHHDPIAALKPHHYPPSSSVESDISSQRQHESENERHGHSWKHHFMKHRNSSSPDIASEPGEAESRRGHKHRHSLRDRLPHLRHKDSDKPRDGTATP